MELIPVKTTDPYYAEAERLMTDAFPPEERRPLDRQRQYTDHNPLFHPQVVRKRDVCRTVQLLDLGRIPLRRASGHLPFPTRRRIGTTHPRHFHPARRTTHRAGSGAAHYRHSRTAHRLLPPLRLPVVGTSHLYTASLRCRPLAAPPAPYGARRFGRRERL